MRAIRNSSLQSVNRYIVTSLHRYIGGGFTILDFRITISSVIYTIHLPSSLGLMRANEFSILELHIPFGARPGFFAPPISRKKIRPTLLDDFSLNFRTANVCEGIIIQQDGGRHCRSKSSQCRTWHRHPANRMGWEPMPLERLRVKYIWLMRFFQNRCANSISAEKSGQTC